MSAAPGQGCPSHAEVERAGEASPLLVPAQPQTTGMDTANKKDDTSSGGCCKLPGWAVAVIVTFAVLIVGGLVAFIVHMAVNNSESEIGADVGLDVAYTEDVDIFLQSGAWAQPSDPTDLPKFTTEMGILGSCFDVSAEEQRLRARAQYEAKGFAHVIADRGRLVDSSQEVDPKNPFGMPSKLSKGGVTLGTVADYQNLSNKELNMIADSDEWVTWLKEELIRKGGLTALPEDSDGRAKKSDQKWLSETSPATHIWNSHVRNSDRLRSGDTMRKGDPTTFGWAGAGNASCEPQLADTNPLKFYSECPASLWDAVSDHTKKRVHLKQLFVSANGARGLLQTSGTTRQPSHDRALFVVHPRAFELGPAPTIPPAPQAEAPQKTADPSDGISPMVPFVFGAVGLENTATGI
eukprot:g18442.t1